MAVPKFFEFFEGFLKAVNDNEIHTAKEVREIIAQDMNISDADLSEMLPSGKQSTFNNRVLWARTYLDKAGLIETPSRGKYRITEAGKKALESGEEIDLKYLERSDQFKGFHSATASGTTESAEQDQEKEESPMEILDAAYQQVEATLASQLMDEIMNLTPAEFEKLVVKLLLNMGYGSGIEEAGKVTQQSNDGGIDGIIKEDQLGFSSIYIQAKQWALDQTVGKPEIQKFVGALQGQQAQKGLFITTAKFSSGAVQYAENLLGAKVVLVDGTKLTKLMIRHNVGVSTCFHLSVFFEKYWISKKSFDEWFDGPDKSGNGNLDNPLEEGGRRGVILFEEAFYRKKNLIPQIIEKGTGRMITVPDGVDAEALVKVLANLEMVGLLSSLAKTMVE